MCFSLKKIYNGYYIFYKDQPLRGQGGSEVDFHFLIVSDRGACSYQELFSEWKNLVPSQSYRIFKSQKYIQLHYAREL